MKTAPVAIDCFSGAGGLSLGLAQAGIAVTTAFDNCHEAVSTYNRNLGPHAHVVDAHEVTGQTLLDLAGLESGCCHIVAGGPPCQGFSLQRRGDRSDSRNDLIYEFVRLVRELRPAVFLMENVPGLLGPRSRAQLREFLKMVDAAGYRVMSDVLDAADFGVPQHRRRAFFVGERDDCPSVFEFPSPSHDATTWHTVRDAIGDLPEPTSATAADYFNHEPDGISDLNRLRISHVPPGGGREDIPEELRLPCHRVSVSKAGHRGVYGRLAWDAPSGTITTKCNSFTRGRFAHPERDRNITMREAARLQGFPDDFAFEGNKVAVAHQIGNAVPPPLARALGEAILSALARRASGAKTVEGEQPALPF